jgi:hypothetical protein
VKQIVEYSLADGGSIWVEIETEYDQASDGLLPASDGSNTVRKAEETFGEALSTIREVAAEVIGQVRSLASPPDEVSVQFGVKLTGQTNIIIASGSAEASLILTLKWINEELA